MSFVSGVLFLAALLGLLWSVGAVHIQVNQLSVQSCHDDVAHHAVNTIREDVGKRFALQDKMLKDMMLQLQQMQASKDKLEDAAQVHTAAAVSNDEELGSVHPRGAVVRELEGNAETLLEKEAESALHGVEEAVNSAPEGWFGLKTFGFLWVVAVLACSAVQMPIYSKLRDKVECTVGQHADQTSSNGD
jgi:hypothetical protein